MNPGTEPHERHSFTPGPPYPFGQGRPLPEMPPRVNAHDEPSQWNGMVAVIREPDEWSADEPSFHVPEWSSLGCSEIRPDQMSRHTLVLGETGSGKTKSAIFPLVGAGLEYGTSAGRELAPSMLIIDPKREIEAYARRVNEDLGLGRKIISCDAAADGWVLDLFEGTDPRTLTADEYVSRVYAVSVAAAREVGGDGTTAFFTSQSESVLRQLVSVDLFLWRRGGTELVDEFWNFLETWLHQYVEKTRGTSLICDPFNYLERYAILLNLTVLAKETVVHEYVKACRRFEVPSVMTFIYASLETLADETFSSIVATMNNRLSELSSPDFAKHVSLHPFVPPKAATRLSAMRALNEGEIVCYYPRDSSTTATMIGKCLKSKFFELTFARTATKRPFMYVCDEFQRFITNDPTSGEQSFLDRCRAYRAVSVLATQSIAALVYALSQDGSGPSDSAALEILFNNTGNKLFFRNTDSTTSERLMLLLPAPWMKDKPHVAAARPVSTLQVGECYFLLSDGRWGRRRIDISRRPSASGAAQA